MSGQASWVRPTLIGVAVGYVVILLLAPLGGILATVVTAGAALVTETLTAPDVLHAFWLTAVLTILTVVVTGVFGIITALVLTRDRFWGRRLLSGLVDLPLAVSPVIVGVMAVILFGRGGWLEPFFTARGIQVLFAIPSMALVTFFICIPFVIRELTPVLLELGTVEEDAARTLGASSIQAFFRVTLPNIRWALLYGIALTTARAMGEIGAVLIVSGAIQGQTETATLYIFRALEERQDASAYVVAVVLAIVSVILLAGIEIAKQRQGRLRERA
jgi:sulfate/thiosulfate transport system permease protein